MMNKTSLIVVLLLVQLVVSAQIQTASAKPERVRNLDLNVKMLLQTHFQAMGCAERPSMGSPPSGPPPGGMKGMPGADMAGGSQGLN